MIEKLKRSNSVGDIPTGQEPEVIQRDRSQSSAGRISGMPVTPAHPQEPSQAIQAIHNTRANLIARGPEPLANRHITQIRNPNLPPPQLDQARINHLNDLAQERITLQKFFREFPPPVVSRFQSFIELFQPAARARRAIVRAAYDNVVIKLEAIEGFQSEAHIGAGPGASPLQNGPAAQTQYLGLAQAYADLEAAMNTLENATLRTRYSPVVAAFSESIRMTHEVISEGYKQPALFEPESGAPGTIENAIDNAISKMKVIWESGIPTEGFVFLDSDLLMADHQNPKALVSNDFAGAGQLNKVAKIKVAQRNEDGTLTPSELFFKPLVNIAYGAPAVISRLPFIQTTTLNLRDENLDLHEEGPIELPAANNLIQDQIEIWVNPKLPQRNVAAYKVSEMISNRPVIVKSSAGIVGITPGIFMEGAPGPSGYQLAESNDFDRIKLDPQFREDLNTLEWNDWITGQLDRHEGNFQVNLGANGQYQGLKGIDNDICFIPAEIRIDLRLNPTPGREALLAEIRSNYQEANQEYLKPRPDLTPEERDAFNKRQIELLRDLNEQEKIVEHLGYNQQQSYNGVGIPLLASREVANRLRSPEFINQLESAISDFEPEAQAETLRRYDLAVTRINELDRNGGVIDDWSQTLANGFKAEVFTEATAHKEQSIYRRLELHRETVLAQAANP
jgi:hypothetical protein